VQLISFMLTKPQIRERRKTVTRRLGWRSLRAGTLLMGVEKRQGIKPGESVRELAVIIVTDVREEPLSWILREGKAGAEAEGFGWMSPEGFVSMFCQHMKCDPDAIVQRIEFRYVPGGRLQAPEESSGNVSGE
jgi:hypothetical protein